MTTSQLKLANPNELPRLFEALAREGFYGEIHLHWRHGEICRVVIEHSQVFNSTKGNPPHDHSTR